MVDIKNYNIIFQDEDLLGFAKDIIKYLKDYSKCLIDDLVEKDELVMIFEILEELEEIEYKDTTFIKVSYNPMGCYQYNEIEV